MSAPSTYPHGLGSAEFPCTCQVSSTCVWDGRDWSDVKWVVRTETWVDGGPIKVGRFELEDGSPLLRPDQMPKRVVDSERLSW